MMPKIIAAVLITLMAAHSPARAGDISPGATPGTINYQGRLERDNSPVTGTVHIYFRIFNSPTAANLGACGAPAANPCLWQSPELRVQAVQGMFTAAIAPPVSVFSAATDKYLEVEIESETLSPREKINSVVYSLIARKLEDGASVDVSTLTAAHSVYLATASGNVGIGTASPGNKLTVNGILHVLSGGIVFPDNSFQPTAGVGSASGISVSTGVRILADSDNTGNDGNFVFMTPAAEFARINNLGNMGVGNFSAAAPMGKLDVDGSLFVGSEGIHGRDAPGDVNVIANLLISSGRITGRGANFISIGETADTIIARTGGADRLWLTPAGNLGVGAVAPANERVYVSGNMHATAGVRGGGVSIGGYSNAWTGLANELRADAGAHLLLQQTNSFNVGIGTDTPREKLHVRGSVRADYGVSASSGYFSGSGVPGVSPTLDVRGNLRANTGLGNTVELSSTVVYGSLQVTGGILGAAGGTPAYLSDTQTFTGRNTFTALVTVSSDVVVSPRLGVGMSGFDFGLGAADRYLQVGDNIPAYDSSNADIYLVGGANADARLNLYRGGVEAARVETRGANTLALVAGGTTRALVDPAYFRIVNSPVWISTSATGNPALFVSPGGNVAISTTVADPTWRLTVNGGIRLSAGPLIFPDGSSMATSSATSASSVSSNSDALVQAGLGGSGSVIIKSGSADGILVTNTGLVGVGTTLPLSRLNVRGGDLVVGSPFQGGYATNNIEDLLIGGSLVVDGGIVQRSATPVEFAAAVIYGDVYLSTAPAGRTGVGTSSPQTKLDVNGDAQFGAGAQKSTFTAAGALNLRTPLTVPSGGTGLTAVAAGNIIYTSGANAFAAAPVTAFGLSLIDDADAAAARATLVLGSMATQAANSVSITGGSITGITALGVAGSGDFTGAITTASSGTFRRSGASEYSIETSSGILMRGGILDMNNAGRVRNMPDPVVNQDGATKAYVDSQLGASIGQVWSRSGNSVGGLDWLGSSNAADVVFKSNNTTRMTIASGGGISVAAFGTAGFVRNNASGVLSGGNSVDAGADITAGTLGVARGGTGTGSTLSGVMLGGSPMTALAAAGASQYLRRNSGNTAYEFAALVAGDVPDLGATPGLTLGTANSAGSALTYVRTNATILAFDGTVPAALGTAATGSATVAARRDHVHAAADLAGTSTTGTLPVDKGGTGATTLTGILKGNGTAAVTAVAGISLAAFQVVGSTITSTCYSLTFTDGILTNRTSVTCN